MLPEDEWDGKPDIVAVLKPMIMAYLDGVRDGYTAEQIIENTALLENGVLVEVEPADVLDGVEATLRALEEDGKLQSKRIRMGHCIKWFYRSVR